MGMTLLNSKKGGTLRGAHARTHAGRQAGREACA